MSEELSANLPECHEGPEAYERFDANMTAFLAVPKTTILRKQRAYRKTPATIIQNYLLLHLNREFPGLDVWRANVVAARAGLRFIRAGEPGQADLTGIWGGHCRKCGYNEEIGLHRYNPNDPGTHLYTHCGRSVWIEIKTPGDSQTQTQKDFERRVTRLGALYIICKVRKKTTVREISDKPARHPIEIEEFFDELRLAL